MIDEKEVTAYVTIPDCFLQGCSEDIVIFRADGGNHFTDYGIYEGMFLFFDRKKRFKKGRLSCYINTAGDDRPKYRVSDKNIDGYKHLGRLVCRAASTKVGGTGIRYTVQICGKPTFLFDEENGKWFVEAKS